MVRSALDFNEIGFCVKGVCMIAVSMGKFGTKEVDRTAVPTQKDPIVIDGNQENPENPAELSFREKCKKKHA